MAAADDRTMQTRSRLRRKVDQRKATNSNNSNNNQQQQQHAKISSLHKPPANGLYMLHNVDHSPVLFFSRPQSEGWPHHGRTFSIYLCPLSFWLTLPREVLATSWCCPSRPCIVFLHAAGIVAYTTIKHEVVLCRLFFSLAVVQICWCHKVPALTLAGHHVVQWTSLACVHCIS